MSLNSMVMPAPVTLFVYNRPWHTRKTLEALQANVLADQSELFVFSDGPKEEASEEEQRNISEVRALVQSRKWCKNVYLVNSETNNGLAQSVVSGVTKIVNQYGKIIVLEDDVVTSSGFLKYMNEALDLYEQEKKVMHISGYMFPVRGELPPIFYYNTASCWGWGTWKDRWVHYNPDAKYLLREIYHTGRLSEFNLKDKADFTQQLQANISGKQDTWAIKWYSSFFLKNGMALHPYPSLTNNIGHDRTGKNCASSEAFHWDQLAKEIPVRKIALKESSRTRKLMMRFYDDLHSQPKNFKFYRRKIIPAVLRRKFQILTDPQKRVLHKAGKHAIKEINRIKAIPRFIPGQTDLPGFPFSFIDSASFLFQYREIFEKQFYHFNAGSDRPLIIDCGSNIGLSVVYFKNLYPESRILAFEPDPEAFTTLKENIKRSGYTGIEINNKGVWNAETSLSFSPDGSDGGKIVNKATRPDQVSIETVRLKDILRNNATDLLKLDIEGAEGVVLEDCDEVLQNVRRIFIEYHSFAGRDQDLDDILRTLKKQGFRYFLSNPGLTSPNPFREVVVDAGMDMQLNIYGIREH